MIINGTALLADPPISEMFHGKQRSANGVSHGLTEVGYDIRIAEDVHFVDGKVSIYNPAQATPGFVPFLQRGRFVLASAIEYFSMPTYMAGIVHDKSTWARKGLSVFNTVIEPGWRGHLTLELVYHGEEALFIPAGSGIAQVIFHQTALPATYNGHYQDQSTGPVPSIL